MRKEIGMGSGGCFKPLMWACRRGSYDIGTRESSPLMPVAKFGQNTVEFFIGISQRNLEQKGGERGGVHWVLIRLTLVTVIKKIKISVCDLF